MPFDGSGFEQDNVLGKLRLGRERVAGGWCQGVLANKSGRYCAVGALLYGEEIYGADWHTISRDPVIIQLAKALPALVTARLARDPVVAVVEFNDARGRTQANVLALYDRAIELRVADLVTAQPPNVG